MLQGLREALGMLWGGDAELWGIIARSLLVSLTAVALAAAVGVPLGAAVGLRRFRGRTLLRRVLRTFMGLPPVVVGLIVYLTLSRSGPLGPLDLLFTPTAMIIAQFLLALPIVAALAAGTVEGIDEQVREAALTLGATARQAEYKVLAEARRGLVTAVAAAYGRVAAEVGAVMLVGGNIRGYTRVMTTAIALETRQGQYGLAIGLGLVLIVISFLVNMIVEAGGEAR
ncbi:MAG: ABC transporter permease [Bacillota bacterium]